MQYLLKKGLKICDLFIRERVRICKVHTSGWGGGNSYVYDITVIICLIYKEEREYSSFINVCDKLRIFVIL